MNGGILTILIVKPCCLRYTFAVEAVDNGSPRLNSTMVILNFTVVDSNDNNPVFYPSSYVAAVKENSPTDTFVVKVNASESDTSPGIGYHISNGNHDEAFQINNLTVCIPFRVLFFPIKHFIPRIGLKTVKKQDVKMYPNSMHGNH